MNLDAFATEFFDSCPYAPSALWILQVNDLFPGLYASVINYFDVLKGREAALNLQLVRFAAACVSMLAVTGCAQQLMNSAQNQCAAFGLIPGTMQYSQCVERQFVENRRSMQQGFANASRSMATTEISPAQARLGGGSTMTGHLVRNYVSGMNRVCIYNQGGSEAAITIGAAEMCPITMN